MRITRFGRAILAVSDTRDTALVALASEDVAHDALVLLPELRRVLGRGPEAPCLLDLEQADPVLPAGIDLRLIMGEDSINGGLRKAHNKRPEQDTRPSGIAVVAKKVDAFRKGRSGTE